MALRRRKRLGFRRADRRSAMREVAAVADLGLPEAEAKAELEKRLISRFDPASILLSILVSWAIKQLIAWIQGKLQDKEYGDEDAEA
jgi:hypothetical protein